jgi:hypothetical protein
MRVHALKSTGDSHRLLLRFTDLKTLDLFSRTLQSYRAARRVSIDSFVLIDSVAATDQLSTCCRFLCFSFFWIGLSSALLCNDFSELNL